MLLFFFQAEDGIRDSVASRGLGDVYKRQHCCCSQWIHEDCVDDVVHGDDSEEKVCPVCLSAI